MPYEGIIGFIIIVLVINAIITIMVHQKCLSIVEQWAIENGLKLIELKKNYFSALNIFSKRRWYDIVVEDDDGNIKRGTAYLGGVFMGMWGNDIEVEWK